MPAAETEGRRGLTIDDRHGGRYLGIPPESPFRPLPAARCPRNRRAVPTDETARSVPASPCLTAEVISTLGISCGAERRQLHAGVGPHVCRQAMKKSPQSTAAVRASPGPRVPVIAE